MDVRKQSLKEFLGEGIPVAILKVIPLGIWRGVVKKR